jgi:hypothetical protein
MDTHVLLIAFSAKDERRIEVTVARLTSDMIIGNDVININKSHTP